MARMVKCVKLGREAEGMAFPPYPGALGKRIWESVSKEAWAQWLKQQTMLVNENRLNLADPKARKYLMEQTERHFFGTGADTPSAYSPRRKWGPGPPAFPTPPATRPYPRRRGTARRRKLQSTR